MKLFQNKFRQHFPYLFISGWSLLILANFVPAIPQPDVIIGYLWKVEFALAIFLLVAIISIFKLSDKTFIRFSRNEFVWIILPLLLFTAWSSFSVFWSESVRNAIHHTLLWACYAVFYLLIRQIVAKPQLLDASIKCVGLVIFILGMACVTEYMANSEQLTSFFTYRYYKYAEASATLLPIFLALVLQSKSRTALLSGFVAAIAWLMVMLCLSRTIFIAGLICIGLFFALVFLFKDWKTYLKKSVLLVSFFILSVIGLQFFLSASSENTALKRFGDGENSQASFNSRFLFWGIAFEEFKQNPFAGIGADNYVSVYKNGRKQYSAVDKENNLLEINEEVLAERAHNEFLQILAELGTVGFVIFGWLLFGILRLAFSMRKDKVSLLSIAAFSGICAFLVSSLASSYSFRVPANGLCFFFVLALFVSGEWRVESRESKEKIFSPLFTLHSPLLAASIIVCAAMLTFSAVRGVSLMNLQFALTSETDAKRETYFQKAIALDDENAMFRYYYGLHLYNSSQSQEAIPQMRFGIDKGIATSVSYFNLASAQIVTKKPFEAEQTFAESLQVYPRSVFLRTAYASILEDNGNIIEAQVEYEKASNINAEQARSWRLAFAEGMKNLSQTEARDKQFVKAMELRPTEAIYALLDFQRQFRPNLVRR